MSALLASAPATLKALQLAFRVFVLNNPLDDSVDALAGRVSSLLTKEYKVVHGSSAHCLEYGDTLTECPMLPSFAHTVVCFVSPGIFQIEQHLQELAHAWQNRRNVVFVAPTSTSAEDLGYSSQEYLSSFTSAWDNRIIYGDTHADIEIADKVRLFFRIHVRAQKLC